MADLLVLLFSVVALVVSVLAAIEVHKSRKEAEAHAEQSWYAYVRVCERRGVEPKQSLKPTHMKAS